VIAEEEIQHVLWSAETRTCTHNINVHLSTIPRTNIIVIANNKNVLTVVTLNLPMKIQILQKLRCVLEPELKKLVVSKEWNGRVSPESSVKVFSHWIVRAHLNCMVVGPANWQRGACYFVWSPSEGAEWVDTIDRMNDESVNPHPNPLWTKQLQWILHGALRNCSAVGERERLKR
jgi:hypothetical protein